MVRLKGKVAGASEAMMPEAPWEAALRRHEGIMARVETLLGKREASPTDPATLREEALRWALAAGSRSGRTARQFIDDLSGRLGTRSA